MTVEEFEGLRDDELRRSADECFLVASQGRQNTDNVYLLLNGANVCP